VVVAENRFVLDGLPALDASSTHGIRFRNNTIVRRGPEGPDFILRSCSDVGIEVSPSSDMVGTPAPVRWEDAEPE
jgi:hypothetical protein